MRYPGPLWVSLWGLTMNVSSLREGQVMAGAGVMSG